MEEEKRKHVMFRNGNIRGVGSMSIMVPNSKMVEMVVNSKKRSGEVLILSLLLVILTLNSQVVGINRVAIIIRRRMTNLRRVEIRWPHYALLASFVVIFIRNFVMKRGIDILNMASQDTCSRIF